MYEQIASNKRSSTLLIVFLFMIVIAVGYFLVGMLFGFTIFAVPIFTILFLLIVFIQYRSGDRLVLRVNHAKLADEKQYKYS